MFKSWFVLLAIGSAYLVGTQSHDQNFGVINAERINIRDKNGTLRAALSNAAGFSEGDRASGTRISGLMFYNEEGQETGGLTFRGRAIPGGQDSDVTLTMDQFRQDQNVYLNHGEFRDAKGSKIVDGLTINARPDWTKVGDEYAIYDKIQKLPEDKRDASRFAFAKQGRVMTRRVFLGVRRGEENQKAYDDTGLFIKNKWGRDAIRIFVDANNKPHVEVLDPSGKAVVYELKAPVGSVPE